MRLSKLNLHDCCQNFGSRLNSRRGTERVHFHNHKMACARHAKTGIMNVPDEMLVLILRSVPKTYWGILRHVCRRFRRVIGDNHETLNGKTVIHVSIAVESVALLEYALQTGCPRVTYISIAAARSGNVAVLKYLNTQLRKDGRDPWDRNACTTAAQFGHLNALKCLRACGASWNIATCNTAANAGHADVMEWLLTHHCPYNEEAARLAAGKGHVDILQCIHLHKLPLSTFWVCMRAAGTGHVGILQWVHTTFGSLDRYSWDDVARRATEAGQVPVLEWLHARVVLSGNTICMLAALYGQLAVLQWARAMGYMWNGQTCVCAARHGHLAVLQWARAHGAPWNKDHCLAVAHGPDVVDWIVSAPE